MYNGYIVQLQSRGIKQDNVICACSFALALLDDNELSFRSRFYFRVRLGVCFCLRSDFVYLWNRICFLFIYGFRPEYSKFFINHIMLNIVYGIRERLMRSLVLRMFFRIEFRSEVQNAENLFVGCFLSGMSFEREEYRRKPLAVVKR